MQFWNQIIQTAMLGTDKKQLTAGELPEALAEVSTVISSNTTLDKEEQFLQMASLAMNYRQSGTQPLQKADISIPLAPPEEKPYCNNRAAAVLKDIVAEDSNPLLTIWLQHCVSAGQLAPPSLLPVLLDKATQHKSLRTALENIMGKRGEWLCGFNPNWQFTAAETDEERWQTGKPEQRRQVLQQLRSTDPALARQWLQETWAQENANSKAELIKALEVNLSEKDLEWLESLATEKSQKVKEEVLNLLKRLPESSVIQMYWEVVQESVRLKKGLLKSTLSVQLPTDINEAIFKTGIERLSGNQNNITDEGFVIYQLMTFIPPHFWETYLKDTPENIIKLFGRDKISEELIKAIGMATGRFKDSAWTKFFLHDEKKIYYDLLPMLSETERDEYLLTRFEHMAEAAVNLLIKENTSEWKLPIAKAVFKYIAANPYQYNRSFYSRNIHLIPVQMLEELDSFLPAEEYQRNTWRSTSEYVKKLLQLKQRTIQSFS
jgi:hypothetical protein